MRKLLELHHVFDSSTLSHLVANNQLVANKSGLTVAVIVQENDLVDCIENNVPELFELYFARVLNGKRVQTRILEVLDDRLLVFGVHASTDVLGVYECCVHGVKLVHPLAGIERVHRTKEGLVLIGILSEESQERHLFTDFGVLALDKRTTASTLQDGSILILDEFHDKPYRYRVSRNGFSELFPIACENKEKPFALACVGQSRVLATYQGNGSRMHVLGKGKCLWFPLKEEWDGKIEYVWQSPSGRSLAWLFKPNGHSARQLYLNGMCIHEGSFEMSRYDLVWSPNELMCGAKILYTTKNGMGRQSIVTPAIEQEIRIGTLVREFLVDSKGKIAAYVTDGEYFCFPVVGDHSHDPATIVWNLHWVKTQPHNSETLETVGYNFSLLSGVYHRSDDPEFKRTE